MEPEIDVDQLRVGLVGADTSQCHGSHIKQARVKRKEEFKNGTPLEMEEQPEQMNIMTGAMSISVHEQHHLIETRKIT